jgi:hypothetical protein
MAAKRLELKNAVEAYDVSGEKEFASHIRKINKAVKRGKRHAFLIYQKPENIRVEHAKKLVNAGYDIFIEKDELDGYIVLVKWLEKKETGGRVYQEGLPEDEVELFRNM